MVPSLPYLYALVNRFHYKTILSANTLKYPCPACGNGLVREAYLGGNIYFCPDCQKIT